MPWTDAGKPHFCPLRFGLYFRRFLNEERMALIVAAFRGESVGIQSIAELLDTSPTQVRSWNRAARRGPTQADPVDTAQPSLTGEQEPPAPDDVA